ncbi:MAG: hypothetical protein HYS81_04050 [Candidatus Aenigmatarchaeota archaeon]|nr:MAG: hypothetical protein HYS81_04050 [Candidatus Aenigmarchaeota archaeon]
MKEIHKIEIGKFEPYGGYVGMFNALENNFGRVTSGLLRTHRRLFDIRGDSFIREPITEVISWNKDVIGYEVTQQTGHSPFPPTPKRTVGNVYFVVGVEQLERAGPIEKELYISAEIKHPDLAVTVRMDEKEKRRLLAIVESMRPKLT